MSKKYTLTQKQELFCQAYIETGNASAAYRLVYDVRGSNPQSINRMAKELMDNLKITARIAALNELHRARHCITVDSLTFELEEARRLAHEKQNPSAMVSATMGKAKLHGLCNEKTEITGVNGASLIPEYTNEERARRLAFILMKGNMEKSDC